MIKTIVLLLWVAISISGAQSSKELLRDGLFAEESEGDLKTATEKYEALLKAFEKERKVAAVALFRLAAVKRKQGDEKGALACYEEFTGKFSDIEPQATLVRENYLALSGKEIRKPNSAPNEEDQEIARLKKLAVTSPDLFPNLDHFDDLVKDGWDRAVAYLLENGADPNHQGALDDAVKTGNLVMVNLLLKAGADPNHEDNLSAFGNAIYSSHWQIAEVLAKHNANLTKSWSSILSEKEIMDLPPERIAFLIKHGGDPNYISNPYPSIKSREPIGIPLHDAVRLGKHEFAKLLLKSGAKVDLARDSDGVRALHLACNQGDEEMIKILIAAGANLESPSLPKKSYTPTRYSEIVEKTPIEIIDVKKAHLLIEAGANLVPNLLYRAVIAGDESLVDYFISKGADPNLRVKYHHDNLLPLDKALSTKNDAMVKHLITSGAKFSEAGWSYLNSEYRTQYARKYLYPDFAKSSKVTIALPELDNEKSLSVQIDPGNDFYLELLKAPIQVKIRKGNNHFESVDLDLFTWNRIRAGKVEKVDFLTTPLPTFQAGDIIEIVGFESSTYGASTSANNTENLLNTSSKIALNLRKAARFPVKISYAGKTQEMLICPDKVTFDARSNELPAGTLGQIFDLVIPGARWLRGGGIQPYRVAVTRENFPAFSFLTDQIAINGFELKRDDKIEIISPEEPDSSEYPKIIARTPGTLGEWHWFTLHTKDDSKLGPTLLALIADINVSYRNNRQAPAETIAFEAMKNQVFHKVLPGIDLEKIMIHRQTANGTEEIQVNLLQKISQWEKSQSQDPPFDLQLQGGDVIEFAFQKGDWKGFPATTNQYFEAALNFPVLKVEENSSESVSINFQMPSWHHLDCGYLSIYDEESLPTIRGNLFLTNSLKFQRGPKEFALTNAGFYWPKAGDIIKLPALTHGSSFRPPTKSSPSKNRVRYVPRPK